MKNQLLLLFFCVSLFTLQAQSVDRIEVSGKIVVSTDDVEGVSVYNTISKKGTSTDEKGEFKIKVGLNDVIEIHSLLFKDFKIVIDGNIIKSGKMTVFLVENVNKLDEIVILPYDLTGNLMVDIESVKTFNPDLDAIYFGMANINDYKFSDDIRSKVDNIAMDRQGQNMIYGLNVVNIVGLLVKPLFKAKNVDRREKVSAIPLPDHADEFSTKFLVENFDIPAHKVDDFVEYIKQNGWKPEFLEKGREMDALEFVSQKSKDFLQQQSDKN